MAFYDKMQTVATKLIAKFGTKVTITRDGTRIATVDAVFVQNDKQDLSATLGNAAGYGSGTTEDVKTILIHGVTKEPTVGDTVAHGSKSYRVISTEAINPGGTSLAFKLLIQ